MNKNVRSFGRVIGKRWESTGQVLASAASQPARQAGSQTGISEQEHFGLRGRSAGQGLDE